MQVIFDRKAAGEEAFQFTSRDRDRAMDGLMEIHFENVLVKGSNELPGHCQGKP
jgi:hypothetical protein